MFLFLLLAAGYADGQTPGAVAVWGYGQATVLPAGLTNIIAITGGEFHELALRTDGTVVGWGSNSYGESTPPANLAGVTALSSKNRHNLALKSDGTVVAWGYNFYGQTNVPAGLSNVIAVAAGNFHSVALKGDGTVVAWGDNRSNQCAVPIGLTNVTAIAAGFTYSLALKTDGTVVGWGGSVSGEANIPAGLTGVAAITAGVTHSVALKTNGTIVCWGDNTSGQASVPGGLTGIKAIAAGNNFTLALKTNGTVIHWGDNYEGKPPTNLTSVISISAGQYHGSAITLSPIFVQQPTNQMIAQGSNALFTAIISTAVPVGYQWRCNGTNVPGGTTASLTVTNVQTNGSYDVVVTNSYGTNVSSTALLQVVIPPQITGNPADITVSAGDSVTLQVQATGNYRTHYWNINGTIISSDALPSLTLYDVQASLSGPYFVTISNLAGTATSAVAQLTVQDRPPEILSAPTNQLAAVGSYVGFIAEAVGSEPMTYQWQFNGVNIDNQTGPELLLWDLAVTNSGLYTVTISNAFGVTNLSASLEVLQPNVIEWGNLNTEPIPVILTNATALAAGEFHTLALRSDGTLLSWGNNDYGLASIPVAASNVVAVAAGSYHSVALLEHDGKIAAWGDGVGGATDVPYGLWGVKAIAAYGSYNVALKTNGTLVAWGTSGMETNLPSGLNDAVAVSLHDRHALILRADGTVIDVTDYSKPTNVTGVISIAAGPDYGLALKADGTVAAWGYDPVTATNIPVNLSNVVAVAASSSLRLALKEDGTITAWGDVWTPVPAGLSNVIAVASSPFNHYFAVIGDGRPLITVQPFSQPVVEGSSVTLHVKAVGQGPLHYQWGQYESEFYEATNSSFTITNFTYERIGDYQVVVSNALGKVTSTAAPLTMVTPPTLTLRNGNEGQVRLAWPADRYGFRLQTKTDLASEWTTISTAPLFDNGENTVDVSSSIAPQFFRLTKP